MAKPHILPCARRDFLRLAGMGAALLAAWPLKTLAAGAPLKIASIGGGRIGSTLAGFWVKAGHQVLLSSRHPDELKDTVQGLGSAARAGTVDEAVAFGDVILLAVPYSAIPEIAQQYGAALAKKPLVLDASNPIAGRDGDVGAKAREVGAGLYLAQLLPGAHIVRAFNAIGYTKLKEIAARQGGERVGMPIAGDDPAAIELASTLVRETGLEPVLVGKLDAGKWLIPGTALAGEHSPDEIKKIAATLK